MARRGTLRFYPDPQIETAAWTFIEKPRVVDGEYKTGNPYVLRDGDELTVYEKNGTTIAWKGTLAFHCTNSKHAPDADHGACLRPDGVHYGTWALWFLQHHTAKLVRGKS